MTHHVLTFNTHPIIHALLGAPLVVAFLMGMKNAEPSVEGAVVGAPLVGTRVLGVVNLLLGRPTTMYNLDRGWGRGDGTTLGHDLEVLLAIRPALLGRLLVTPLVGTPVVNTDLLLGALFRRDHGCLATLGMEVTVLPVPGYALTPLL